MSTTTCVSMEKKKKGKHEYFLFERSTSSGAMEKHPNKIEEKNCKEQLNLRNLKDVNIK